MLSFTRIAGENNTTKDCRDSFSHYYVPNVEIKYFNVLIGEKSFFDLQVKKEDAYEKIIDMSNNNDYTNGNLLDFVYFRKKKKKDRLIPFDLSKQTKLKDPQQINFIGKDDGAKMFFINEKSEETTFNFTQNSVTII